MKHKRPGVPQIVEIIFDIAYLLFAFASGVWLLTHAQGDSIVLLYGAMALTLGAGDSFHLVPRIYAQWTSTMSEHRKALGVGKAVTSVTMTAFYVMLYYVWQRYFGLASATAAVWLLAAVRVALCLFPQNGWYAEKPPLSWAIIRNIPFAILGGLIVVLFAATSSVGGPFRFMPIAVTLSFLFYFIVVLFADKNKKLGMFMLPKTCMYIWIICMGFGLL